MNPFSEDPEAIIRDYATTFAIRGNKKRQQALHLFFSPYPIPIGLDDMEVALCILLYEKIYKTHKASQSLKDLSVPLSNAGVRFPDELRGGKVITRKLFRRGIEKLLKSILEKEFGKP